MVLHGISTSFIVGCPFADTTASPARWLEIRGCPTMSPTAMSRTSVARVAKLAEGVANSKRSRSKRLASSTYLDIPTRQSCVTASYLQLYLTHDCTPPRSVHLAGAPAREYRIQPDDLLVFGSRMSTIQCADIVVQGLDLKHAQGSTAFCSQSFARRAKSPMVDGIS